MTNVKIAYILLLSLLVPQAFLGLPKLNEVSFAAENFSSEMVSFTTSDGPPLVVDREEWWLDIQYPVDDYHNTTSGWGDRSVEGCKRCSEFHRGLDFTPGRGSPVYAIMDGVITQVQHSGEYGMHVIITHEYIPERVYTTVYAHLQVSNVTNTLQLDNNINKGDLIGYVGNTGLSTGSHLHFEVRKNGVHLNPAAFFDKHIRN